MERAVSELKPYNPPVALSKVCEFLRRHKNPVYHELCNLKVLCDIPVRLDYEFLEEFISLSHPRSRIYDPNFSLEDSFRSQAYSQFTEKDEPEEEWIID